MPYNIQLHLALPRVKAGTRKQAFEILAGQVCKKIGYPAVVIFNALMAHERVSTSGIGNGVAIPHLRLERIQKRFIALSTLQNPIDFNASDNMPVDVICLLLSPESDGPIHLRGLSRISRLLKNQDLIDRIRETRDADIIVDLFANPEGWVMAA